MISTTSNVGSYQTLFSNGVVEAIANVVPDKGGDGIGFRPHELLEAALATCMNITLRMAAEKYGIALAETTVKVSLDRSDESKAVFQYSVKFDAAVAEEDRQKLLRVVERCPVRRTLGREMEFARVA